VVSLAERLAEPKQSKRCRVGEVLDTLDDTDREALQHALVDSGFATAHILRALLAEGFPLGKTTVQAHRNQDCACSRTA
jgi:hypothetical protein